MWTREEGGVVWVVGCRERGSGVDTRRGWCGVGGRVLGERERKWCGHEKRVVWCGW